MMINFLVYFNLEFEGFKDVGFYKFERIIVFK